MTLPDESDAERAANRRDNKRGAIVAGVGLVVVLVVGGVINVSTATQQDRGVAGTSHFGNVQLPTYAVPDETASPSPTPSVTVTPVPTQPIGH